MVINYLVEIFAKQKALQKIIEKRDLNRHFYKQEPFKGYKIFMVCTALIHEAIELQRETGFKWWKKENDIDVIKIREEVADLYHFIIQLSLEVGLTPDDLYKEYLRKCKINEDRQNNNY
jgi:dimeric dUTPase (all-alpha-NTP-PPase superfamily)